MDQVRSEKSHLKGHTFDIGLNYIMISNSTSSLIADATTSDSRARGKPEQILEHASTAISQKSNECDLYKGDTQAGFSKTKVLKLRTHLMEVIEELKMRRVSVHVLVGYQLFQLIALSYDFCVE